MRIQNSQSVANLVNNLSLDLKQLRTLTRPSRIKIGLVGAALGLRASVLVGQDVALQDSAVSGANRFPIDPDDFFVAAGLALDNLDIAVSNNSGAAIVLNWVVEVHPIR